MLSSVPLICAVVIVYFIWSVIHWIYIRDNYIRISNQMSAFYRRHIPTANIINKWQRTGKWIGVAQLINVWFRNSALCCQMSTKQWIHSETAKTGWKSNIPIIQSINQKQFHVKLFNIHSFNSTAAFINWLSRVYVIDLLSYHMQTSSNAIEPRALQLIRSQHRLSECRKLLIYAHLLRGETEIVIMQFDIILSKYKTNCSILQLKLVAIAS